MTFPRCRRAVELWSESLDRPLPLRIRFQAWFHWFLCSPCRRYVKQTDSCRKAAMKLLNEAPPESAPPPARGLSPQCRERILQAMKDAQNGE